MNIVDVVALKWLNSEHTMLGGTAVTTEFGSVPVCIHENYDLEYGRKLWDDALAGKYGPIHDYIAPTQDEIRSWMNNLSRKDFRLKLKNNGVNTTTIQQFLDQIEDEDLKEDFQIEWEDETEFNRMDPFVVALFEYAGITPEEADKIWEK